MKRFMEGADRTQGSLLPECVDDYVAEDNPVRVARIGKAWQPACNIGSRQASLVCSAAQPVTATRNAKPASKGTRIGCSEAGTYFLLTPDWVEAD